MQDPADSQAELPVLVLVRDLMFASRISVEARRAGVPLRVVREPADLAGQEGRLLVVDLQQDGAVEAAGEWRRQSSREVVGFFFHVNPEAIARAFEAGIRTAIPRSRFVEDLPRLLKPTRGGSPSPGL